MSEKHGGGVMMVWGCFIFNKIDGTVTCDIYKRIACRTEIQSAPARLNLINYAKKSGSKFLHSDVKESLSGITAWQLLLQRVTFVPFLLVVCSDNNRKDSLHFQICQLHECNGFVAHLWPKTESTLEAGGCCFSIFRSDRYFTCSSTIL